ncbi:hypothetical protein A5621_14930 [Mycobacterium colombiense]|nr:hypothetical protein A5621_14930 [Mycobacterium colombiense]
MVTDSTAYLPTALVDSLGITVVALYYDVSGAASPGGGHDVPGRGLRESVTSTRSPPRPSDSSRAAACRAIEQVLEMPEEISTQTTALCRCRSRSKTSTKSSTVGGDVVATVFDVFDASSSE